MPVIAKNAVEYRPAPWPATYSDVAPTIADSTTPSQIEFVGVRVFGLILCQCFEPGQRAVTAERVDHAAVGGDRRHAAEELGDDADEHQELGHCRCPTLNEISRGAALTRNGSLALPNTIPA